MRVSKSAISSRPSVKRALNASWMASDIERLSSAAFTRRYSSIPGWKQNVVFFVSFDILISTLHFFAFRESFTHYLRWCQKNHHEPENVCATVFVQYLDEMSQELASATIQRRIASLSQIFKLTSTPNITKEPEVLLTLKKTNRRLSRSQNRQLHSH